MSVFKVLVCGGRTYSDWAKVYDVLDEFCRHNVSRDDHILIIHGDAPGADKLAGEWARDNGIQEVKCPANWGILGKRAGPIRNSCMLWLAPTVVVAFPGGRGTANMVNLARRAGVPVQVIE